MIKNFKKKFKPRRVKEIERTAYHEAGHAFVRFKYGMTMKKASIIQKGNLLGYITIDLRSRRKFENSDGSINFNSFVIAIQASIAGLIAEALYSGRLNIIGAGSDFETIDNILISYFPDDEERGIFLEWIMLSTFNLLSMKQFWPSIENFAETLLERKYMSKDEIYDTFYDFKISQENFKLPPGLNPDWLAAKELIV